MKLLILDGNSIANRAYYGVHMLNTADGTPTNAIFGFLNIFRRMLAEEKPQAVCVTFDEHAPTFRREAYAGYKAQRKGMDDELRVQMPLLREVLDAMRVSCVSLAGYEADDLLGAASAECEKAGWECVIATGDRDSLQLVSGKTTVRLIRSRQGMQETVRYTPEVFREQYGFEPKKLVDLKALMGDTSDNIPGVPGVGEKTAMTLVQTYGGVEEIYGALDTLPIRETLRKKLSDGRESMEQSFFLATILREVPGFRFRPEEMLVRPPENDRLYRLFTTLEFRKLIDEYRLTPPADQKQTARAREYRRSEPDAWRTEWEGPLWGAAFREDFSAFALAAEGESLLFSRERTRDYERVLALVLGDRVRKSASRVKELQRRCLERGIRSAGWCFDTALAAWLLDPAGGEYDLEYLAETRVGLRLGADGEENGQLLLRLPEENDEQLWKQAEAVDALTLLLSEELKERGQLELLTELELPLCGVLAAMEKAGAAVDRTALEEYGRGLGEAAERIRESIFALAGHSFNVNSPKQLGDVLFAERGLPAPKKTKTGWSTGAEVLEKLSGKDPIVQQILDYRELSKLKSTYVDGLADKIGPDGRIHTTFQMTATATGRLSSAEPNLQNIPVRSELGGEIRKMFRAPEGKVLVDADYSQIELRILAHISGDETLRRAFLEGRDVHTVTASQVFGVPEEEVTGTLRSRAKAVNFGIVYGISAFSLAQNVGSTVAEAKEYIRLYLERYDRVRAYQKEIVRRGEEDGYVCTPAGRRRYLPELRSSNFNLRSFGERAAMNAPIQGAAADVMKRAMILTARRLERECPEAELILQIHDELIVECPEEKKELVAAILKEEMERAGDMSVPLPAEAGWGRTWFDAK